ncbi:MAG: hypothetical protein MZV63_70925 [Marinilabiliales bacterium]|nr:hypothetical protein [Marinilabiliales bacterium]
MSFRGKGLRHHWSSHGHSPGTHYVRDHPRHLHGYLKVRTLLCQQPWHALQQRHVYSHHTCSSPALLLSVWYSFTHQDGKRGFLLAALTLILSGIWLLTDSIILDLVILAAIVYGAWYLSTRNRVVLNTIMTAMLVIVIGYSSIATIVIRSTANTPDE